MLSEAVGSNRVQEVCDVCHFRVNTDSFDGTQKHLCPAHFNVFTDGSKTGEGVGAGFAVYKKSVVVEEMSVPLPDYYTVFMAEVVALRSAAECVLENLGRWKPTYIEIHCDSRAALMAVNSRKISSKEVSKAIDSLNRLGSRVNVALVWIKAHALNEGNENADTLAKAATIGQGRATDVGMPQVAVNNRISECAREEWQEKWGMYDKARQTKQFCGELRGDKAREILGFSRQQITRLIAIITGHGPLAYHLSL